MIKRSSYWKKEWQKQAKDKNPFVAAGASNFARNPYEFLHQLNAVYVALDLKKTDLVLDAGCNTGLYAVPLAPWVSHIEGIDFAPALVKEAQKHIAPYRNIRIQKGDILAIPFRARSFDKVMVNSVIQYLDDMSAVERSFREIARVLKPKGRACIALIPSAGKKQAYLDGIWKLKRTQKEKKEIYDKNNAGVWFEPRELITIARKVGLRGKIVPVPSAVWQSWYMFTIVLKKI